MTSRAELEALIARVEGATGSDSEIDADLEEFLEPALADRTRWKRTDRGSWNPQNDGRDSREPDWRRAPSYTHSLDEAVALIERVLPGQAMRKLWEACIECMWGRGGGAPVSDMPKFLIHALLRAMHAQATE